MHAEVPSRDPPAAEEARDRVSAIRAAAPPPGLSVLELVLRAPRLLRDPFPLLLQCRARYGDVWSLPLRRPPVMMLNHPSDIRHVLLANSRNYRRSQSAAGRQLLGNGILTSEDPLHAQQRRLIQPWFQRQRVQAFVDVMQETTRRHIGAWTAGGTIEVCRDMSRLTLAVLGSIYLSTDLSEVADDLLKAVDVARQFVRQVVKIPESLPLSPPRRHRDAAHRIHEIVGGLVQARRDARDRPDDLLTALIEARDATGQPLSDAQVRDEVVGIVVAGHETTAMALSWAWYLLAGHRAVEERLHQEVDAVLGGAPARAEHLPALRYTSMVLDEAMRLYPPLWVISRVALADDRLESGVDVPAGTLVCMPSYAVHRDPRFFPDPDTFDPLRFTPEAVKARPAFAYFPFGDGPRGCPGEGFAVTEGLVVLATVAQRFRLARVTTRRARPEPLLTLRPRGGMTMRVLSR